MHPLTWTQAETSAVIGAFKFVCSDGRTKALLPIHDEFLEGFRDHIFHHSELDLAAIESIPPSMFAERITDPEHRVHALEYLTLAPYIEPEMRSKQADRVAAYFSALHMRSDAFSFMNNIAHRHILMSQLCIARKLLPHLLPGGPLAHIVRAVRMVRESRGDAKIAGEYQALENLPEGTLGNAFYRFHRLRGFQLPGEKGCIPEELSALHDLTHILSFQYAAPREVPGIGERPCSIGRRIARVDEHGRHVVPHDVPQPIGLDLGHATQGPPYRNPELVTPHVGVAGGD